MDSLVSQVASKLLKNKKTLSVAESCTGGFLSNAITNFSGASQFFERGVVVYSNGSKIDLLKVSEKTLKTFGAVSVETAKAMALGLLKMSRTDYALAITGIAGPTGGTQEKPVGTVFIACADRDRCDVQEFYFKGSRLAIKKESVRAALQGLLEFIYGA